MMILLEIHDRILDSEGITILPFADLVSAIVEYDASILKGQWLITDYNGFSGVDISQVLCNENFDAELPVSFSGDSLFSLIKSNESHYFDHVCFKKQDGSIEIGVADSTNLYVIAADSLQDFLSKKFKSVFKIRNE